MRTLYRSVSSSDTGITSLSLPTVMSTDHWLMVAVRDREMLERADKQTDRASLMMYIFRIRP